MTGRALGVDVGSRRIGLALSDPGRRAAQPYRVIERSVEERDVAAVLEVARAEGVGVVVVGLPLRLNGTRGTAAEAAEAFAERLRDAGARVEMWDERLSTVEAERTLRAAGLRGRARRRVVDKVAAAVILQSFLDARA